METWQIIALIITAVLGSKLLDTVATRYFRKENDHQEAGKTRAEASDILARAAETTLSIMQTTIQSQDDRLRAQDQRIQRLEDRVLELHAELLEYKKIHGPLDAGRAARLERAENPQSGESIHITGDITGTVE